MRAARLGPYPFVALEGTDGSGKSTLRLRLAQSLRAAGFEVTEFGQHSWLDARAARAIVGTRLGRSCLPPAEVVRSYLRDKSLHYTRTIQPATEFGHVLVDRYVLSDLVYHNVLHQVPLNMIRDEMAGTTLRAPDFVVFVDTPPEIAWQRILSRGKQLRPYERPNTIKDLYQGYLDVLDMRVLPSEVIRFRNDGELLAESVDWLVDRVSTSLPAPITPATT
jgi:dTMP kinase